MVPASHQAYDFIQKNAVTSGVINAIINGAIGWFMFRGKETIPLTVDTISAHEKTVFSTGVMTAFMLMTSIYIKNIKSGYPFLNLPNYLWMIFAGRGARLAPSGN
ncbi:MAG: hypothetical protein ACP5D7_16125 [Limnospira sp.]